MIGGAVRTTIAVFASLALAAGLAHAAPKIG